MRYGSLDWTDRAQSGERSRAHGKHGNGFQVMLVRLQTKGDGVCLFVKYWKTLE
jgi:hypothetical protein